jgi:hypothetical protein
MRTSGIHTSGDRTSGGSPVSVQNEAQPLKASIDIVKEGSLLEMLDCCYLTSSISLPSVIV